jgi:ABC-type uncharacterized transport system auxiliary subunit
MMSGCSITKTIPQKTEYLLTSPQVSEVKDSACSNVAIKIEPIQSSNVLRDNRIYYIINDVEQHAYTQSLWAENPNRSFEEILKNVLIQSKMFSSVLDYRSNADTQWRYEVRILDFMQYFKDNTSYVNVAMDFVIIKNTGREVVASKHFQWSDSVQSLDAKGGVSALNSAMHELLRQSNAWLEQECKNAL